MKKYIVIETRFSDIAHKSLLDTWTNVYDTLDAAMKAAGMSWNHTTETEKKTRHIEVAPVTEDDLMDGAIDEDTGEIDWSMLSGYTPVHEFGTGEGRLW